MAVVESGAGLRESLVSPERQTKERMAVIKKIMDLGKGEYVGV